MHTGIGSVLIQAHLAKVTEIFAGLPLIGFFVFLAFVILENLLGFPVIYIGALIELHSIIIFHALYYTRVGLDCQGLNPKSIVLALRAQARDGELLEGEGIAEGGVENIATTASADPLLDSFLAITLCFNIGVQFILPFAELLNLRFMRSFCIQETCVLGISNSP